MQKQSGGIFTTRNAVLCAMAGALTINCPSARADGETKLTTGRFRIICDFTGDKIAGAAGNTMLAVDAAMKELFGPKPWREAKESDGQPLLRIRLYRTQSAYEAIESDLASGRFKENLAFSSAKKSAAYVAVQPPVVDKIFDWMQLSALTRYQIAHETAHVISYVDAHGAKWPDWLAEGAAKWAAARAVRSSGCDIDFEHNPFTSTDMWRVQQMVAANRLPPIKDILTDKTESLEKYERYSLQWMFFEFMMKPARAAEFRHVLKDLDAKCAALGKKARLAAARELMTAKFREIETGAMDRAFVAFIRKAAPQWTEESRSLEICGTKWRQIAFPRHDAVAWSTQIIGITRYDIEGSWKPVPTGAPDETFEGSLLFGADGVEHMRLTMRPGSLSLTHVRTISGKAQEREVARASLDTPGTLLYRFRVRVRGGAVSIYVNGKEQFDTTIPVASPGGLWGVRTKAGCAGEWVEVRPKKARR